MHAWDPEGSAPVRSVPALDKVPKPFRENTQPPDAFFVSRAPSFAGVEGYLCERLGQQTLLADSKASRPPSPIAVSHLHEQPAPNRGME